MWAYVRDRKTKRITNFKKIKNKNRANKYSVLKYKKNSQLVTGKKITQFFTPELYYVHAILYD